MSWFSKKSDLQSKESQFIKLYCAASAAFQADDLQRCIDLLLQAINIKDIPLTNTHADAWNYVGAAKMKLYDRDKNPDHLNEAEGALLMARTLAYPGFYDDPNKASLDPVYNLGYCYYKQKRFAEAEECFLERIRRKPSPDAFLLLGCICHKAGRKGEAVSNWEQGLKIDPTNSALKENLENAKKFY